MSDRVLDAAPSQPKSGPWSAARDSIDPAQVLRPPTGTTVDGLRTAWRRRALVRLFAHHALQKIYARTFLGRLWLLLRPGVDATLRIAVLGSLIGAAIPGGVPYAIFAIVGLTAWQTFETGGYWATRSLEINRGILRRTALPRLPILLGCMAPAILYFALYTIGAVFLLGSYWVKDGELSLVLGAATPQAAAGMALILAAAAALGLWLSPLAVRYRDVRFVVPIAQGGLFFLTPIIYPLSHVDGVLKAVATWNPITPPVLLVQHGLLGTPGPRAATLVVSVGAISVLFIGGLIRFLRAEGRALGAA